MKTYDLLLALTCFLLTLAASIASGHLLSLDTPGVHEFPFIAPWISIALALLAVLPGMVLGGLIRSNPLLLAIIIGFFAGVVETTPFYYGFLVDSFALDSGLHHIGILDYLAAGTSKAIYLCAFTAAGIALHQRVLSR